MLPLIYSSIDSIDTLQKIRCDVHTHRESIHKILDAIPSKFQSRCLWWLIVGEAFCLTFRRYGIWTPVDGFSVCQCASCIVHMPSITVTKTTRTARNRIGEKYDENKQAIIFSLIHLNRQLLFECRIVCLCYVALNSAWNVLCFHFTFSHETHCKFHKLKTFSFNRRIKFHYWLHFHSYFGHAIPLPTLHSLTTI